MPIQRVSRIDSEEFMVLVMVVSACRCPCLCDPAGVAVPLTSLATTGQRAAQWGCSAGGDLLWRRYRSAVEGGARVSTNVFLRDLDISPVGSTDSRRLDVVAEGLSLYGGCQLATDATLVSALKGDGTHRRKADMTDGVALLEARKNKETTYPELGQGNGRAQFGGDRRRSRREVVVGDQKLLVVLCLRESSVRVLSAQRQCSSSLVQEMELSSRMYRRQFCLSD